ncbi:MAG TPA: hypothetical protein VL358_01300 [Caulobacteraceae bacterium]|jgi:hypothetical protein|nr:hypothetical protein [Caulobacteraceae bacterium]
MVIASLFAFALAAADGPIATSPELRPAAPAASPAPSAPLGPVRDADIPASAPTDDYGFVAWCHGALTGHMELHDRVRPELQKVSPGSDDSKLMAAGEEYLALYARALKAAEKASPSNIHNRGAEADAAGYRIWSAARAAEPRTQMWSYLMWELPPRCEIVAKQLEERSTLFAEALRPDPNAPPGPGPAATERAPADKPALAEAQGLRGPK